MQTLPFDVYFPIFGLDLSKVANGFHPHQRHYLVVVRYSDKTEFCGLICKHELNLHHRGEYPQEDLIDTEGYFAPRSYMPYPTHIKILKPFEDSETLAETL